LLKSTGRVKAHGATGAILLAAKKIITIMTLNERFLLDKGFNKTFHVFFVLLIDGSFDFL
jgi:hypothetical protein